MEYFVNRDGREEGPLSLEEINQRLAEGTMSPTDSAWHEGMSEWKPLETLEGVAVTVPGAPWGAESNQSRGNGKLMTVIVSLLLLGTIGAGVFYGIQWFNNRPKEKLTANKKEGGNATDTNATDTNASDTNATSQQSKPPDPSPRGVIDLVGHTNTIVSLSFSPDGRFLVSGDAGGGLKVWNAESGAEIFSESQPGIIKQVMFYGNNPAFFALSDQQLSLWNVDQKKIQVQATKPPTGFTAGALNPINPNSYFAVGLTSGMLEAWNTEGKKLYTQRGHTNSISVIKFSSNGSRILTGGVDNQLKVWDSNNGKLIKTLPDHTAPIAGIDIHPSGSIFASASHDGAVIIWNVATLQPYRTLNGHEGPVRCVSIHPTNAMFVVSGGHDRALIYWNLDPKLQNNPIVFKIADHAAPVTCITFAPNASRMATGSEDQTIKIRPLN